MPPFQAVRPEHVLLALEEFDRIGADEFLSRYGFDRNDDYELGAQLLVVRLSGCARCRLPAGDR